MEDGHAQAPDTCPYPRPFADDFSACPAYFPRRWPTHTSTGQPLQTVWTCWHLGPGSEEGATGHYYARCALGDQQARAEWAESAGSEQLACYRRFRQALGTTEDELIEAAVPRQVAVGYPQWGEQSHRLRPDSLDQLAVAMLAAAEPHAHLLQPSGIRVEDWVLVTRSVLDHLMADRSAPWTPTPAFLDSLSPMARKLVGALAGSVARPAHRAAPGPSEG